MAHLGNRNALMSHRKRHTTVGVRVGNVLVGGDAPVVVQSMTNTDTADAPGTAKQCIDLANAGSELVRSPSTCPKPPQTIARKSSSGSSTPEVDVPIIGDFHYNGHVLLPNIPTIQGARQVPHQSRQRGERKAPRRAVCDHLQSCIDNNKPVRIGVNGGSLNQELVIDKMQENTDRDLGKKSTKSSTTA